MLQLASLRLKSPLDASEQPVAGLAPALLLLPALAGTVPPEDGLPARFEPPGTLPVPPLLVLPAALPPPVVLLALPEPLVPVLTPPEPALGLPPIAATLAHHWL